MIGARPVRRTPLTAILTLVAVLASTLAVAGCGGKSGSSSTANRRRAAPRRRDHDARTSTRPNRPTDAGPHAEDTARETARPPAHRAIALIPTARGSGARRRSRSPEPSGRCRAHARPSRAPARPRRRTSAGRVVELSKPLAAIVACAAGRSGLLPREHAPCGHVGRAVPAGVHDRLFARVVQAGENRGRAQRAPAPGEAEGAIEGRVEAADGRRTAASRRGAYSLIAGTPP